MLDEVPAQPCQPAERVRVAFTGEGCGVEEMSWGQWEIWLAMVNQRSALAIGGSKPLPAGTKVDEIADELAYLMSRFQTMRTRLRFDRTGRPMQALSDEGEIVLEVFDTGNTDPDHVLEKVEAQYRWTPYDYEHDWPVRMAVIRHHGALTHMVVYMHHLTTDATGGGIMVAETARRHMAPAEGIEPFAQARWQRSPAGVRQSEAALRHWERVLQAIPVRRFIPSDDPREPRAWVGEFRSEALLRAVNTIATRTGADTSPILLAMFAVAVARQNGINPVMARPLVSNRFRPGLKDVVCMVAQNGICALDVAGISLDEAVIRAARATVTAYKYAYYDPQQLSALIAQISAQRGPTFDVSCYFNDRRVQHRSAAGDTPASVSPTSFTWIKQQNTVVEHLFIHFDDVPDTMQITLDIDTHAVSPADGEALLYGIETVAIEAAADGSQSTAVT